MATKAETAANLLECQTTLRAYLVERFTRLTGKAAITPVELMELMVVEMTTDRTATPLIDGSPDCLTILHPFRKMRAMHKAEIAAKREADAVALENAKIAAKAAKATPAKRIRATTATK